MTEPKKPRSKRLRLVAAVLGVVLGMACQQAPEEYRAACGAIVKVTTVPGCF